MISFEDYLLEDDDTDTTSDTKRATINMIASNFFRFINSPDESDNKAMLMLIAALSILNLGDDNINAEQIARRLVQSALVRSGRKKGK